MITTTTYSWADLEDGTCRSCGEETDVVIDDGRCPDCIEEQKFYDMTMKSSRKTSYLSDEDDL